ncbi:hypothetical protein OE88DRAFT_1146051 [Heliocybe sulcata]|uniref:Uncharacterized protein n=1 Tax=Heliocybe sulcata TaxID=5364 RepID=A0A5C3N9N5_9AGAM|nr:hypothetical protein OE88DRAFT_1146051 [Heliocybe sulcata]
MRHRRFILRPGRRVYFDFSVAAFFLLCLLSACAACWGLAGTVCNSEDGSFSSSSSTVDCGTGTGPSLSEGSRTSPFFVAPDDRMRASRFSSLFRPFLARVFGRAGLTCRLAFFASVFGADASVLETSSLTRGTDERLAWSSPSLGCASTGPSASESSVNGGKTATSFATLLCVCRPIMESGAAYCEGLLVSSNRAFAATICSSSTDTGGRISCPGPFTSGLSFVCPSTSSASVFTADFALRSRGCVTRAFAERPVCGSLSWGSAFVRSTDSESLTTFGKTTAASAKPANNAKASMSARAVDGPAGLSPSWVTATKACFACTRALTRVGFVGSRVVLVLALVDFTMGA